MEFVGVPPFARGAVPRRTDEIGLDVVAQHNIQKFLKHYQQVRGITILLTSHYMKDVAALCKRVVIIAGGEIVHDKLARRGDGPVE